MSLKELGDDIEFIYYAAGIGLEIIDDTAHDPAKTELKLKQLFIDIRKVITGDADEEEEAIILAGCTSCATCINCRNNPVQYHDCIVNYC